MSDYVEYVAKAIWEKRREMAAMSSIELEPWGDGTIPKLNHVMEEAQAAIDAMREDCIRVIRDSEHLQSRPMSMPIYDVYYWETQMLPSKPV